MSLSSDLIVPRCHPRTEFVPPRHSVSSLTLVANPLRTQVTLSRTLPHSDLSARNHGHLHSSNSWNRLRSFRVSAAAEGRSLSPTRPRFTEVQRVTSAGPTTSRVEQTTKYQGDEGAWRGRGAQSAPSTSQQGRRRASSGVGWNLTCSRDLALIMPGNAVQVESYLSDPENIVHVAFPDTSRLKRLGPELWQARLKPVTFFMVSATPVCTIRAWYEPGSKAGDREGKLRIHSEELKLEFIGAPEEVTRVSLKLYLDGHLGFLPGHRATGQGASGGNGPSCLAGGKVDLGVGIEDLPLALALIPAAAANQVGSAILATILDAMKGALTQGLVRSFRSWQIRQPRVVQR